MAARGVCDTGRWPRRLGVYHDPATCWLGLRLGSGQARSRRRGVGSRTGCPPVWWVWLA